MPIDLEVAANAVREWAKKEPLIRRVFFFGSQVKGTARPTSDLDIALEFDFADDSISIEFPDDPHPRPGLTTWCKYQNQWKEKLSALLGVEAASAEL